MVGVERGTVRLVAYDDEWRSAFAEEADRLRDAFGERVVAIEHVGSTAIEGMVAKPVIDVLVVVEEIEETAPCRTALGELGYTFRPDDPVEDRLFFAKGPETGRTHYLSVTERGSDTHVEQLAFRDFLRDDPDRAKEYARLKRELAAEFPDDRESYTEGKSRFVRGVLEEAMGG